MAYTQTQIDTAFGIFSGRINPETDLQYFDDAQSLYNGKLVSTGNGGAGNPGPTGHRQKAEAIIKSLILTGAE